MFPVNSVFRPALLGLRRSGLFVPHPGQRLHRAAAGLTVEIRKCYKPWGQRLHKTHGN